MLMDPGDDVRKGRLTLVVQRSRARVLGGKGGAPRRASQDERRSARTDPCISRDLTAIHERTVAHTLQAKGGRNEPFPCGSGKKFKKCCGAPADLH